ncbi:MAG: DNA-formamidopyrimidine glycosylase family protein [Micrococcales bacterium]|nr:DNA-formamidopyrimidine glycosylase family protein [Micrococcales bacterium]
MAAMPEGDTVAWTAAKLHRAFAGQVLTRSDLRWPSLATVDLTSASTIEVTALGKHLLHRLDSGLTLHSHLRMDGTWRVRPPHEPISRHHLIRAVLGTARATAVGRSLGMLDLVPTSQEHTLVGHLGPDILDRAWGTGPVVDRIAADSRPLAQTLLDQRVLAGLGTFWVSEALYAEQLHPWRPGSALVPDHLGQVLDWARRRMRVSARTGIQTATGHNQGGALGAVHARSGRPCRRCAQGVRVALVGAAPQERTIFYCPSCQGGLAPGDDGRPQAPLGARRRRSPGH